MRRLALALALLACAPASWAEADPSSVACHAFTPDAEYVDTTVIRQLEGGEITLRVPRHYFEDAWDQAGGSRDTAQLFVVEIGSFEPVTRREESERNRQGIWNWMHFIVGDNVPLDEIALIQARLRLPDPELSSYPRLPGPRDLMRIESARPDLPRPELDLDVYLFEPSAGAVQAVLACDKPGTKPFPGCKHFFRAGGLDVSISYRRTELPRWHEFQAQVTAFLTCAASDPA